MRVPNLRESYLLAAERLTESAVTNGELDELAAPIIYCLRHTLELAIKDLIYLAFDARDIGAEFEDLEITYPTYKDVDALREHSLRKLAKILTAQLQMLWSEDYLLPTDLSEVVEKIHQMEDSAIGEAFRYVHRTVAPKRNTLYKLPYRPGGEAPISLPETTRYFPAKKEVPLTKLTAAVKDVIHSEFFDKTKFDISDIWDVTGLEARLIQETLTLDQRYTQEVVMPGVYESQDRTKQEKRMHGLIDSFRAVEEETTLSPEEAAGIAQFLEAFITTADED